VVDALVDRFAAGEGSPGLLLAAAVSRDERFMPFVRAALLRPSADRNTFLSAAIAAEMLGLRSTDVVAAMTSRLEDPSLRDRLLGFLLALNTAESLEAVAVYLESHFDPPVCAALGQHEAFAVRAAELAWKNRDAAGRSLGFSLVSPLMVKLSQPTVGSYLEGFAFGHRNSTIDGSLRAAAIEGLAALDPALAFEAARGALADPSEKNRTRYAKLLVDIDPERAARRLLERLRLEEDEEVEIAIADVLQGRIIEDELLALLESEDPAARRSACILACRGRLSDKLRRALRDRALDIDEKVAAAAMRAVREDLRAQGVEALVHEVVAEPPGERRWVLLDLIAQAARGTKDQPPIRTAPLAELAGTATPLEARAANEILRRGRDEFHRAVHDRARRRSDRQPRAHDS